MTLKKMIDADKICANQLFLRKSASRFSSPVRLAHLLHKSRLPLAPPNAIIPKRSLAFAAVPTHTTPHPQE